MDKAILEAYIKMEQRKRVIFSVGKMSKEWREFKNSPGYAVFMGLSFYKVKQRELFEPEKIDEEKLFYLVKKAEKSELKHTLQKDTLSPAVINFLSKQIGVEAPEFSVVHGSLDVVGGITRATVSPEDGCKKIVVRNNKSLSSSKNLYGQNVWQFFMYYYHELTHAKQCAEMQDYFFGNDAAMAKYKLMFFNDIFTECIYHLPKSFAEKIYSKVLQELSDKSYFLNPQEVDARMEAAKFVLSLKPIISEDEKLLNSYEKYAHSGLLKEAEITNKTGTKMLQELDKKKEVFEKNFGSSDIGKIILEKYAKTRSSSATKDYEKQINDFGKTLAESKKGTFGL